MKKALRILIGAITVLSVLLFVATAILWVRSYQHYDAVNVVTVQDSRGQLYWEVSSAAG